MLRLRIPATSPSLGPNPRLPIRLGRRVSQEEMAEVVGVSRNWYRRLESRQGVRASTKLLSRLAAALFVSPDEQVALFALAVPEIWPAEIYPDSKAVAKALGLRTSWVTTSNASTSRRSLY